MPASNTETPLTGGNTNPVVVRVGNTVRRATGPCSDAVHRFLLHLEARNFTRAPRFLGIDEAGREILSFIPGSAQIPADIWTDDRALVAAARLLRDLHDASAGFDDPGLARVASSAAHDVICHNDFAPYNMIFANGLPVGIVDFDLAGPGPRQRDLAYLAYWMVPLSFAAPDLRLQSIADLTAGSPRLHLICETYDLPLDHALLDTVSDVLHHMGNADAAAALVGPEAAKRMADGGHFQHWRDEAAAFDAHKPDLARSCLTPRHSARKSSRSASG